MSRSILLWAAAILWLAASLATASPAGASPSQITILDASKEATGFYGERRRRAAIRDLDGLGVDVVRVLIYWPDAVPESERKKKPPGFRPSLPASYDFPMRPIDRTVREAARRGIGVMLVPTGRFPNGTIPRWASRHPRLGANDPRPGAYRDFMHAIGARYNGRYDPDGRGPKPLLPAVQTIAVWDEPNYGEFLTPQSRAPQIYRSLIFAARRGLHSAGWDGTLLAGETSPGGFRQTAPVEFMRRVLCPAAPSGGPPVCSPIGIDGWSHHPYGFGQAPWEAPADPGLVTIGSLGRLDEALPAGLSLYLTEFGYESEPDPLGLPPLQQSEFLSIAERIAYEDPHVASFAQYLLRDDPPFGGGFSGLETGLRFHRGSGRNCESPRLDCKPAWYGFKTPLAARLVGDKALLWGRARPADGPTAVRIVFQDPDGSSGVAAELPTDAAGYFSLAADAKPGRRWRVEWGPHQGPFVRGYAYP